MKLNFKILGQGKPIIILHGLFGMLDNWITFGRALSEGYQVYLVDQRNHGSSGHTAEHDYFLMSNDVLELCDQEKLEKIILIGHSMGAKTAMRFALDHPTRVEALILVDMGVKGHSGGHETIFRALQSMDLAAIQSRKEAEDILSERIPEPGVRQFLLKNLTRNADGSYAWKFNLQALYDHYDQVLEAITSDVPFTGNTAFVRGARSGYISNADWDGITAVFPNAELFTIPEAGHWVHADQPQQLYTMVTEWLHKHRL